MRILESSEIVGERRRIILLAGREERQHSTAERQPDRLRPYHFDFVEHESGLSILVSSRELRLGNQWLARKPAGMDGQHLVMRSLQARHHHSANSLQQFVT